LDTWDPNGTPSEKTAVLIDMTYTVSADAADPPISFFQLTMGNSGGTTSPVLILSTTIAQGGNVTINNGATFRQGTNDQITVDGDWIMYSGSVLDHIDNAGTITGSINIAVSGTFDLQSGAAIQVNGLGFDGGASKTAGFGTGAGGGSGDATLTEDSIVVESGQEGHVFVAGLTSPIDVFDWPGDPPTAPKGVYLPNTGGASAGTVIGKFDGRDALIDILAGADLDALNGTTDKYGVTTARRAFLGHWGYDTPGTYDFDDFVTAGGAALMALNRNFERYGIYSSPHYWPLKPSSDALRQLWADVHAGQHEFAAGRAFEFFDRYL